MFNRVSDFGGLTFNSVLSDNVVDVITQSVNIMDTLGSTKGLVLSEAVGVQEYQPVLNKQIYTSETNAVFEVEITYGVFKFILHSFSIDTDVLYSIDEGIDVAETIGTEVDYIPSKYTGLIESFTLDDDYRPRLDAHIIPEELIELDDEDRLDKELVIPDDLDIDDSHLLHKEISTLHIATLIEAGIQYGVYKYIAETNKVAITDEYILDKEIKKNELLQTIETLLKHASLDMDDVIQSEELLTLHKGVNLADDILSLVFTSLDRLLVFLELIGLEEEHLKHSEQIEYQGLSAISTLSLDKETILDELLDLQEWYNIVKPWIADVVEIWCTDSKVVESANAMRMIITALSYYIKRIDNRIGTVTITEGE